MEKCKKYWKSQGISEEEKSGNPEPSVCYYLTSKYYEQIANKT